MNCTKVIVLVVNLLLIFSPQLFTKVMKNAKWYQFSHDLLEEKWWQNYCTQLCSWRCKSMSGKCRQMSKVWTKSLIRGPNNRWKAAPTNDHQYDEYHEKKSSTRFQFLPTLIDVTLMLKLLAWGSTILWHLLYIKPILFSGSWVIDEAETLRSWALKIWITEKLSLLGIE